MKKIAFLVMACAVLFGCSKTSDVVNPDPDNTTQNTDNTRKYITMSTDYKALSASTADFTFELLKAVDAITPDDGETVVISPLSAAFALAMTANGAANETRDIILSALCGDGFGIDALNDYYCTLMSELPNLDKTVTLKLANSIWIDPSFTVLPTFTANLNDYYNAEAYELNVDTAVSDINSWCSRNTDGLITDFFSEENFNSAAEMILLNALYFNGQWEKTFDKDNTKDDTFINHDGSESTVSYMCDNRYALYYEGDCYSEMSLYLGNRAFCLQIVLPDEGVAVSECLESIDAESWSSWLSQLSYNLDIMLPKFSSKYKESLKATLESMGLGSLFCDGDFSNISDSCPIIADIKQETVFSIDEEGAEAASVTEEEMIDLDPDSDGGEKTVIDFHVNRPFLFFVTECSSDTIIFAGRVTQL